MKTFFLRTTVILAIFMLNVASMCSSDDSNSNTTQDPQPIINNMIQGTWRISSYVDSGNNETNDFAGFNFTFNQNGTINVMGNGLTTNGTWSIDNDDDSNDDNPNSDLDFNIQFSTPALFLDLTDDWNIVSSNATTISLIDISGGNGGTDTLVFTKVQ